VATRGLWPLLLGGKGSKPAIVRAASWSARWSRSGEKRKVTAQNYKSLSLAPFYFAKFYQKKKHWVTHMKMQILKVTNVCLLWQIKK
jgi:hypothetical protein